MGRHVITSGDHSCEITFDQAGNTHVGLVKYRIFEVGKLFGATTESIEAQFESICALVEDGAMIRQGTIMTGYHNRAFQGDVLLLDGEILGEWLSDDEEWCYFTVSDASSVAFSAPSPWMLQDAIADWLNAKMIK
ncbi:hypothetical protein [Gymnodinialimonas ulvae]|uniref:hypothetical protein n=1 Tax=Gymnodinialimonas ulvae TaxID=3126504 RepID=UPI0030953FE2